MPRVSRTTDSPSVTGLPTDLELRNALSRVSMTDSTDSTPLHKLKGYMPAPCAVSSSLILSSSKSVKPVKPVNRENKKGLRTPTLHRLHRLATSCGMVALSERARGRPLHSAIATLPTSKGPCARACGPVDVLNKRGFVAATAAAARSGCHGGPSSNRVGNVLGGRNA